MNTKKILMISLLGLLLITSCGEEDNEIADELPMGGTSYDNERQALSNRIDWLHEAVQSGNLTPECKAEEIETLVADIENWNARSNVPNIGLLYKPQQLSIRVPIPPQEPCILLPCEPIRISNGWICFNTGTAGCDSRGRPICTYVCIRIAGP